MIDWSVTYAFIEFIFGAFLTRFIILWLLAIITVLIFILVIIFQVINSFKQGWVSLLQKSVDGIDEERIEIDCIISKQSATQCITVTTAFIILWFNCELVGSGFVPLIVNVVELTEGIVDRHWIDLEEQVDADEKWVLSEAEIGEHHWIIPA